MRYKVRKITLFRGKYGNKKETVTDTFVSITVSVMAKVHEVDTILQEAAMQQLFSCRIVPLIDFVLFR